ncbi:SdrD B-like domain-containing protein, partial [Pleurocapsa sp. PCC 7319]|uniref:SdrD B-like domain-containing protein n=1 Tax=Pleurocapsa sp. PCC 7319 TaxID=118161 RepID=UPI001181C2E6
MKYSRNQEFMINNSDIFNNNTASVKQFVFIDSQVEDFQALASGVVSGIEIVILDRNRDGIQQITAALRHQKQLSIIHIVSHGSPGCLYLGNTQLSLDTLDEYSAELKTWFPATFAFSPPLNKGCKGDILLYGCNVAAGDAGEEFITKLHQLTGAEIAASTTSIGNAAKGGNWELDVKTSDLFTELAFTAEIQASYSGVFAPGDLPWDANPANNGILVRGTAFLTCGTLGVTGAPDKVLAVERIDIRSDGTPIIPESGEETVTDILSWSHEDWTQEKLGNIYGTAVDGQGNMFATASANYGSGVGFGINPQNINYGSIGREFGGELGAAGTIYKMDAVTGTPIVFAQLPQQEATIVNVASESSDPDVTRQTGPGLGNIHHDKVNDQFFVSNFEDGRIYRLDSDGTILDSYDPGSLDDGSAGTPPISELVYGLAVSPDGSKLFYGQSKTVYAIDLNEDGSFPGTVDNTTNITGSNWDNYVSATETPQATLPEIDHNIYVNSTDIIISDLEFLPNGKLLVGGRVYSGKGVFSGDTDPSNDLFVPEPTIFSSYNHGGSVYELTENGETFSNLVEIQGFSTVTTNTGNDDGYGGVAYNQNVDGSFDYVVSSADITTEAGPHGLAVFPDDASNLTGTTEIRPKAAIGYDADSYNPNTETGNDLKGVGGDVDVFNPGVIKGNVSEDTTGDGDGDTPIADVTLSLLDSDGNPVLDAITGEAITTVTDANGNYEFTNLLAGTYTVVETQPDGLFDVSENEGGDDDDHLNDGTANSIKATVVLGEFDTGNDFVETATPPPTYKLSGTVLDDTTNPALDAIDNPGDTPIEGVTVEIFTDDGTGNPTGDAIASTTTDASGFYEFTDLANGDYVVVQTQPVGYSSVTDADAEEQNKILATIADGDVTGQDFLEEIVPVYKVSGTVLEDTNAPDDDGIDNPGDTPIEGVTVEIFTDDGSGNPSGNAIASTTTDGSGFYEFTDLPNGDYVVIQTQPADFGSVTDADAGEENKILATIANSDVTGQDFLEEIVPVYKLSGTVLEDTNAPDDNGIDNPGDTPIEGVTVEIFADDGSGNPDGEAIASTTTDASGFYEFTDLPNGNYVVVQTQPIDYDSVTDIDGTDDNKILATIADGDVTGQDFLEETPPVLYKLSGTVLEDTNAPDDDGIDNPGDTPIEGVTLELFADDGSGNPSGNAIASTTTDASGFYEFTDLLNGNYVVVESQPANYVSVTDADAGTNNQIVTSINDADSTGNDFLEELANEKFSLGNRVWQDTNNNGEIDDGESGIDNVTVNLYQDSNGDGNPDGVAIATETTANGGYYRFDDLTAGDYVVEVAASNFRADNALEGLSSSATDEVEPDDDTDSNDNGIGIAPDPINGIRSNTVTLGPGFSEPTGEDFVSPAITQVSTTTTTSTGGNGTNVRINAVDSSNAGSTTGRITIDTEPQRFVVDVTDFGTNFTGFCIEFAEFVQPNRTYTPVNAITSGPFFNSSYNDPGDIPNFFGVDSNAPDYGIVTQAELDIISTAWANVQDTILTNSDDAAALQLLIWELQNDQTFDLTSGNFILDATGGSDTVDANTSAAITKVNSWYTNVTNGTWTGSVPLVIMTIEDDQDIIVNLDLGVGATDSQSNLTVDFGFVPTYKLSGTVLEDTNAPDADGIDNPGDTPIEGVTVEIFADDGSGNPDGDAIASTTTDVNGFYEFTDLANGNYVVVQTQPGAFDSVTDIDGTDDNKILATIADADVTGRDFLEETPPVVLYSLSGTVLEDTNDPESDAIDNPGDTPIAGVSVELFNADADGNPTGDAIASTTTDENGFYNFTDLANGNYVVVETQPGDYDSVTDVDGVDDNQITATIDGADSTGNDFLEETPLYQLSGTVYEDTNLPDDNAIETEDTPISGVTVELFNADVDGNPTGDAIASTTTDENGFYNFTDLANGNYVVVETQPGDYDSVTDVDGVDDNQITATIDGADSTGNDFLEETPLYQLSGTVYEDTNLPDDNAIETEDTPIAGVTVELFNADVDGNPTGDAIASTTTDENGFYNFTDLANGNYVVVETQPGDYDSVTDVDGVDDNQITATIDGADSTGNDFLEETPLYQLSGTVYEDTNLPDDNAIETEDTPISGVTVELFNADVDGNPTGEALSSTTTDEAGFYQFTD